MDARKRTRAFTELQSTTCSMTGSAVPGKGNDKGKVEGWSAICGANSGAGPVLQEL